MAKPNATNAISPFLFMHLRQMYQSGIRELKESKISWRIGINGFHGYALSSYPLAIAAWEAYLNETCMSATAEIDYPNSLLWDMKEQAEKWEIRVKSILVPKLLLGATFNKSAQPYQDFQHLVSIRNHIVHFRLEEAPMNTLKDLSNRRITLIPPQNSSFSWPLQLQSTEGVRWAINTISKMVETLTSFFPYGSWPGQSMAFTGISDKEAKGLFLAESIDPETNDELEG